MLKKNTIHALLLMTAFFSAWLCLGTASLAQVFDERFETWPVDLRIRGSVMATNGDRSEKIRNTFLFAAGAEEASIVNLLLPGGTSLAFRDSANDSTFQMHEIKVAPGQQTLTREESERVSAATGVWVSAGNQISPDHMKLLLSSKDLFQDVLRQSGIVCFENGSTPVAGHTVVVRSQGDQENLVFESGLNMIPDTTILTQGPQSTATLLSTIHENPDLVGIGIEPNTCVLLGGRKISVLGQQAAHFFLAANDREPVKTKTLRQAPGRRASPYRFLLDLTAWRRQAIDRQLPAFPPLEPEPPAIENGTLYIVGGGGLPEGMMTEFVQQAGGKDARLVYVPCTDRENINREPGMLRHWREMGVASATVLHTKDRNRSNGDEQFLAPLRQATGIWFGGGRQWNFSDSYYGTAAHQLMKEVLTRGGVIGGSSAGASIQGRYLARANPLANLDIMAAGYERGLGFLSGVAIDQHFTQRRRQKDLTQLVNRYPQLLGIGIDETTALIVNQSVGRVVGAGQVYFYDRTRPVLPGQPDYVALPEGFRYNLVQRTVLGKHTDDDSHSE